MSASDPVISEIKMSRLLISPTAELMQPSLITAALTQCPPELKIPDNSNEEKKANLTQATRLKHSYSVNINLTLTFTHGGLSWSVASWLKKRRQIKFALKPHL